MALRRLNADEVYRIGVASYRAFADWQNPTALELNANPTNDPNGLIWDLACAINTDGSTFDVDDPEFDESTTFCQRSGNQERMSENATVVFDFARAKERWLDATDLVSVDADTGKANFNASTLAQSLLTWRDVNLLAFMSIGKGPNAAFTAGDRISLVGVGTDWGVDSIGTGSKATMVQNFSFKGDLAWNVEVV